ncbi:MAG: hypothetical protein DRO05_00560 [Thermoproteota archaeon]|nr:MAG: hypothetical protein DRO05_00560 [Candidatus Korarchaeota archaeon]
MEEVTMIEAIKEELIKQREKLIQYCHDEECDSIYTCPQGHEKCKKKLDLDTAIAWVAGHILSSAPYQTPETLRDNFHTLLYLYEVVRLHKDRYPTLTQLLRDTVHLVDYLITWKSTERY